MKEAGKINILVSNDDGILSEGIQLLANMLSELARVVIVAPDRDRSGASNSLTLDVPLRVRKVAEDQYAVNGTPTDAVHLALTGMLDIKFDMVVSGINRGANLGDDILYSGTVAAATEGRFLGLPSIAISLAGHKPSHYADAAQYVKELVLTLKHNPLPANTILNINIPDVPASKLAGTQITRLGKRHAAEPAIKQVDPRGNEVFWIGKPGKSQDVGLGTDFFAIEHSCVSITPLKIDLTHYDAMEQLSQWVDKHHNGSRSE